MNRLFSALLLPGLLVAGINVSFGQLIVREPSDIDSAILASLTLGRAQDMVLSNNRDIAIARGVLNQASADVKVASQRPNPQLGLLMQNYNPSTGVGSGNVFRKTIDSAIRIDQAIERGGKYELRVEASKGFATAATDDVTDVIRQVKTDLGLAYYELLAAQERFSNAQDTTQLYARTIEAAELRRRAGDLAGSEAARVQVDALRAFNDEKSAQADLSRAQIVVATLIGAQSQAQLIRAVSPWAPIAEDKQTININAIVQNRADVRAAIKRVAATERLHDLARALNTRDVSVGVQIDHYPLGGTSVASNSNSLGVYLSVPLFVRHRNEGTIARAEADVDAARLLQSKIQVAAYAEVASIQTSLVAAQQRQIRFESELLPQARRGAASAEFAFKNGALGVMDLLDSRRTLKQIQSEATQARAEYAKALFTWKINTTNGAADEATN